MKLNINDYVWVKLTDKGRAILKAREDETRADLLRYGVVDRGTAPRVKSGYTEFQLWELMRIFGKYMFNGSDLSFETAIYIDEEPPDTTLDQQGVS